jgi:hypothetical protein
MRNGTAQAARDSRVTRPTINQQLAQAEQIRKNDLEAASKPKPKNTKPTTGNAA